MDRPAPAVDSPGSQFARWLVADPVVDLMNRVFDAQRADAAAQRADADKRELQLQADSDKRELQQRADADRLQAKMEAEMTRREQEAADEAGLQMRVQQLETAARMQTECTPPPAVQLDPPPPVTCSVTQLGSGHAATPAAGVHAQPSMTAAPAGAHAPAPPDSTDMQQLLTSRAGPGDAHARILGVTATSSQVYTYPTVPAQADSVPARTPLADLDPQPGLPSALTGASALPTQTPVHASSASIPVVGTGQPGPQPTVLTDSRHDLTLPQYTMPPPAAPVVAYTQQPWATDVGFQSDHVIDERLTLTAYGGTIFASRPSQYIPVSIAADSQALGTRPLVVGLAGPARPYVEPTQTNATHPHAFTTTTNWSNSVVGQSGESLSLFTVAPTPQLPQQLLPSAGQMLPVARDLPASIPTSAALQPSTHALNLTVRDGRQLILLCTYRTLRAITVHGRDI